MESGTLTADRADVTGAPAVAGEGARYTVERELARGGAGRILVAHDARLGRAVALKVPLHGASAARLHHEARVVASLEHPAIVPIHDAGELPDGTPFYAMKLVLGRSLRDEVRARPTLIERLPLVSAALAIVDAIAHAHSRGVIHRDLKPGNVLVGAFGETVVIDWGLAKLRGDPAGAAASPGGEDAGDRTAAGTVQGTPAYMPPEQARGGDIDERSDVYSLGAVLYEVLAGQPPYQRADGAPVIAQVLDGPPRPLRALAPEVPSDLDAIIAKAMARAPADRYPSAVELGRDLRRFLDGRLVSARGYSAWERLGRWARRRRALLATAAAALVALAVLGAISARRVVVERDRARAQERRAEAARAAAERQRIAAEELLDFMLGDLRDRLKPIGRLDALAGVGDRVEAYYREVGSDQPGDRAAAERRARAATILGEVAWKRRDLAAAERSFRAALDACAGIDPPDLEGCETAAALGGLGDVLARRDDDAGSRAAYGQAAALLDAQIAKAPAEPQWRRARAFLHNKVGLAAANRADAATARAEHTAARGLLEELLRADPADDVAAVELGETLEHLGDLAQEAGDGHASLALYQQELDLVQRLAAASPDNTRRRHAVGFALMGIGDAHYLLDESAAADEAYQRALPIMRGLAAMDPTNTQWRDDVDQALNRVAATALDRDPRQALAYYTEISTRAQALAAAAPGDVERQRNVALDLENLSAPYDALGRHADATAALERALALVEKLSATDPSNAEWLLDRARLGLLAAQHTVAAARRAHVADARDALDALPPGDHGADAASFRAQLDKLAH